MDTILSAYIRDNTIPLEKRRKLAGDLDAGNIDEDTARGIITTKYKGKYDKLASIDLSQVEMGKKAIRPEGMAPENTEQQKPSNLDKGFQFNAWDPSTRSDIKINNPFNSEQSLNIPDPLQGTMGSNITRWGADVINNTAQGLKQGVEQMGQGAQKIFGAAGSENTDNFLRGAGSVLSPSNPEVFKNAVKPYALPKEIEQASVGKSTQKRLEQAASGALDIAAGGMGTYFAPAGGVVSSTPGIKEAVDYGMGKIGEGFQFGADKFKEGLRSAGVEIDDEQSQLIDQGMDFIKNLLLLKTAKKTGESPLVQKTLSNVSEGTKMIKDKLVESGKNTLSKTKNTGGGLLEEAASKATGINADSLKTIVNNPKQFAEIQKKGIDLSRENVFNKAKKSIDTKYQELTSTGKAYDPIRNSGKQVQLPERFLESQIEKFGLKINKEGTIQPTKTSKISNKADITKIQDFYDTYKGSPNVSSAEWLTMRDRLTKMSKFDAATTGESSLWAKNARVELNKTRNQLSGLEQLDKQFAPLKQYYTEIRKLIYDRKGNLKYNHINVINNLVNKGKEGKLVELEKIAPGIGKEIKAIKALQDVELAKGGNKVGTYLRNTSATGALMTGNIPLAAGIVMTSPSVIVPILKAYGELKAKISNKAVKEIVTKVNQGEQLSPVQSKQVSKVIKTMTPEEVKLIMRRFSQGVASRSIDKLQENFLPKEIKKLAMKGKRRVAT